jgi:hypothetical protein
MHPYGEKEKNEEKITYKKRSTSLPEDIILNRTALSEQFSHEHDYD